MNTIVRMLGTSFVVFSSLALAQVPQENVGGGGVCSAVNSEMQSSAAVISKKYQEIIAQKTAGYTERAQKIKEDAPKPDAVEAMLNFDVEVTSHDQEMFIDLPEVTVKDQRMSMDLPQVTMRRKDMSFDNPTIVMRMSCIPGPPEVVCSNEGYHDDFGIWWPKIDCRTRPGKEICTDLPTVEMRRVEWSMDVPETTIGRTEWVMGVPEFKMTTQRIVLTLPDITVKNVKVEVQQAAEAGNQLSNEASGEMSALSSSMKEEIAANAAKGISSAFECQRAALKNKISDALVSIDSNIKVVSNALEDARTNKANDLAVAMEQAQLKLISVRADVQKKLEEELEKMNLAERKAIDGAVKNDLPELKV